MPTGSLDTANRPLVLIWELTQACDLACEHCRAEADPTRHPDELSTAEGKALLDDAAAFGEGQLVVLSGGDPLVRDDVTDLVAYGTDRGLRMTITPSGTTSLTADAIGDLADAGLRRMAVSLDGASPERHDAFRGETGSFAETIQAAEDAREAGVPLQINTTVCAQTVADLPAIRDVVRELDAVMWSVFFLVPVGRGRVQRPVPFASRSRPLQGQVRCLRVPRALWRQSLASVRDDGRPPRERPALSVRPRGVRRAVTVGRRWDSIVGERLSCPSRLMPPPFSVSGCLRSAA